MRPADDRHMPVGLHRLQIDQRHRVGLLIDGDDRAGEVWTAARLLRREEHVSLWPRRQEQEQSNDLGMRPT